MTTLCETNPEALQRQSGRKLKHGSWKEWYSFLYVLHFHLSISSCEDLGLSLRQSADDFKAAIAASSAHVSRASTRRQSTVANRKGSQTAIANSSDIDSGTDDGIVVAPAKRRLLKEVSIPVMATSTSGKVAGKKESASPTDTTLTSAGSTPRYGSVYDTPGTTPATSIKDAYGAKRKHSSLGKQVAEIEDSDEEMEDADETLARRLQEEEYAHDGGGAIKRRKTHSFLVDDSEDDESELSEPPLTASEDSDDDIPLIKRRNGENAGLQEELEKKHLGKRTASRAPAPSKGKKAGPPARAARQNARKSIGSTLKTEVENSDDELTALSDSGDEFTAGESEAQDTDVSDAESDTLLGASRDSTAAPSAPPAKRGSWGSKGRKGFKSRRQRFGNHTAENAAATARNIDEIVELSLLSRKERERKKLEKSHPQIKTMWDDLEKIEVIKPVAADQPQSISRKLKPFQLEGLNWMIRQEKSNYKGGLLGDEMGMGKTIQAVSLIMSDYPQKDPTVVVVPPVALMQWSTEIKEYTDGKLNVLVYHGQNSKIKGMSVKELKKYDVIMISYNSLESLYRKETKGWSRGEDLVKEDSPIHAIHFHRLILDEAHSIKSRTTGVAKACFALNGTYKWCLSGTPVQNRIGEFFSLLRFLEVRPFADYFCKRCPCSILHWKLDEDHMCGSCKHSGMEHVSVFNQELLNPLTQSEDPEVRSMAMDKLHMITARIMLRRVKRDHTSSMEVSQKTTSICTT